MQCICGFFECIGVVGDYDVVDCWVGYQCVDLCGECVLQWQCEIFVVDVGDLFCVDVCDGCECWYGVDQEIDVECVGLVVGCVGCVGCGVGDCVVGGEDGDVWQCWCG